MGKNNKPATQDTINKAREMRLNGQPLTIIALACGISAPYAGTLCKGIKVDLRKKRFIVQPPKIDCLKYPFSRLSPEDQKRYNECKPSKKHDDTYITAKKDDYAKAAIFRDYQGGMMV